MIKVTFSYDPVTNAVTDVTAVQTEAKVSVTKTAKKAKSSDCVTLNGGSLQLNQSVLDQLGVLVGDRLCVRFNPHPVLVRPDIANEPKGGNLISKGLTVSVRGKVGEQIAKLGSEFIPMLKSDGYLNLVVDDGTNDAERQASVEDKPVEIDDNTIDDSDFLTDIDDGIEIDFTLSI